MWFSKNVMPGVLRGGACGVGGVHDAAVGVAAFAGQVQLAVLGGEGHAQLLQPGDRGGRVLDRELGGLQVAQAGARDQGVVHVGGVAVALGQHGRDAALGPVARAVGNAALGHHGHAVRRGELERSGQSGETAADDEDVKSMGGHLVGV
jgi:hypothetical protein